VLNVQESLDRAAEERQRAWTSVFVTSAVPELAQLQRRVAEMATPPRVSETVVLSVQRTGTRVEAGTRPVVVPWSLGCTEEKTFTAKVFEIQREWRIRATTQPTYFTEQYTIPYRFYIETYGHVTDPVESPYSAMDRKELHPTASSTVTVQARQFDWEVEQSGYLQFDPSRPLLTTIQSWHHTKYQTLTYAPGSLFLKLSYEADIEALISADVTETDGRVGKRYTGTVNLDYALTRSDGEVTLKLRNHPADGNFAHVYFVIEETPRDIGGVHPPIRTVYELSTVAVELHLPRAYFEYVEGCKAALAKILDYIHRKRIPVEGPPIPPWDPTRFPEVLEYLQVVNSLNPTLIPREMLSGRALDLIRTHPPQRFRQRGRLHHPLGEPELPSLGD
jgi:hypothetical protein